MPDLPGLDLVIAGRGVICGSERRGKESERERERRRGWSDRRERETGAYTRNDWISPYVIVFFVTCSNH